MSDSIIVDRGSERFRRFINVQMVKFKKISNVGSLFLLILNLSLTAYLFIEHRGIHPYLGIPVLFVLIGLVIWFLAHVYLNYFEMYRTEAEAEKYFNPYAVYAFGPWEEVVYRNLWIPVLEGIRDLHTDPDKKDEVQFVIDRFVGWMDKGFVPREDFPVHLRKFYKTKQQVRL